MPAEKIDETIILTNDLGLHLRAAAQLVRIASKFKCKILVKNKNGDADGKSLVSLLVLAAVKGSEVKMTIEGEDAEAAWKAIHKLFEGNFGEIS
jgi:phosphocarrier protein HPr